MCVVGPPDFLIGCDLERIEARENQFFEDYFTSEEMAFCRDAPMEKALAAYLIWSAKESILKALREGMRRDTRSVLVLPDSLRTGDAWNTWSGRCLESSRKFYGWWRAHNPYIYTLASDHRTSLPEQILV